MSLPDVDGCDTDAFIAALKPWAEPAARSAEAAATLENARLAVENDPVRLWLESDDRQFSLGAWKAMMLAPDLLTCEALMRGEQVPLERLDAQWVQKFGLR